LKENANTAHDLQNGKYRMNVSKKGVRIALNWDALTAVSTALSTIIIFVTAIVVFRQLREMKRATVATAFSSIAGFLQSEEVRNTRRVLMRISEQDFTKWTDDQIKNAEIACSTYDVFGIMLREEVINHKMVTSA